ncbi:hypothetical protein [Geothermobacter hydrogeniphilus]|uniref:Lipoprotein n=1 Tax=Geothermobacter hydrogeniphilus TaxID=1969733 RepID=A0A1X0XI33_9BACT|nr:hypothetical protein [Geothermobacter hydrogeniphilus]ORJ52554.1 hypothetical protein B5V00_16730 [Geothermobacter hydrogeniphilus]
MRHLCLLLFIIISTFFAGCVQQSEYDELKKENEVLKKRLSEVSAELEDLKFGKERLLKVASAQLSNKEYSAAKKTTLLLTIKHPEIYKDKEYLSLTKRIDAEIKKEKAALAKKRKKAEEEARRRERIANKNIKKKYDEFQKITWFRTKRNVFYHKNKNTKFKVELYFGKEDSGEKFFRLKTRYEDLRSDYHETNWIFYEKVQLISDNGASLVIRTEYPDKQSDNGGGGLAEWSDNYIKEDKIFKFENSKTIKVMFDGKYRHTFKMTKEQLAGFKEIINKYKRT